MAITPVTYRPTRNTMAANVDATDMLEVLQQLFGKQGADAGMQPPMAKRPMAQTQGGAAPPIKKFTDSGIPGILKNLMGGKGMGESMQGTGLGQKVSQVGDIAQGVGSALGSGANAVGEGFMSLLSMLGI